MQQARQRLLAAWPWVFARTGITSLRVSVAPNIVHKAERWSLVFVCGDQDMACPSRFVASGDDVPLLVHARVATLVADGVLVAGGLPWWLLADDAHDHERA